MSAGWPKGKPRAPETIAKMRTAATGRPKSAAEIENIRIALLKHWDGKHSKTRRGKPYREWRMAVLSRDGYQCKECGALPLGRQLHTHHIKDWNCYPELRFDVANGITLCRECHVKIEGKLGSPESIKKSANSRRGIELTTQHRANVSAALIGRRLTEEHKKKLRKPKPPRSEEHKRNLAMACRGKKMPVMSNDTKEKIRLAMIGRRFSQETLRKMSEGQRRRFGTL